jgi:hypothetical protein
MSRRNECRRPHIEQALPRKSLEVSAFSASTLKSATLLRRDEDRPAPRTNSRSVRRRIRREQGRVRIQGAKGRAAQVKQRNRGGRDICVRVAHGVGHRRINVRQRPVRGVGDEQMGWEESSLRPIGPWPLARGGSEPGISLTYSCRNGRESRGPSSPVRC